MSINLFYPDNQKIAERVAGVLNGIVNLQAQLSAIDEDLGRLETETLKKLRALAKQDDIITIGDAKNKVAELVPKEYMEKMEEFLTERVAANEKATNAMEIILMASLAIGRIKTTITVAEALQTATAASMASEVVHAVKLVFSRSTFHEGVTLLKEIPARLSASAKIWENSHEGTRLVKFAKWAKRLSSLIEKLGVALDVILIIVAAVEGAKQRDALISNLGNLFTRRILVQMVVLEAKIPLDYISSISSIVTIQSYTTPTPDITAALTKLEESVLKDMAAQKAKITFDYAYYLLNDQDVAGHTYRDHDPTLDQAKKIAEQIEQENNNNHTMALFRHRPKTAMTIMNGTLVNSLSTGPYGKSDIAEVDGLLPFARFSDMVMVEPQMKMEIHTMDFFWPDNPNRKRRAQELYDDLVWIRLELQTIKRRMEVMGGELRPNLDACNKAMGITSFSDLESQIERNCNSQDVARWKESAKAIDTADEVQGAVFGVVNIVGATVGVIGIATTFFFPPLGGALLEIAGAIEIGGAILQGLIEIVEGATIRDECRQAIWSLFPKRLDARVAYERMQIMTDWMKTVNEVMKAFENSMTREAAAKLMSDLHLVSKDLAIRFQSFGPDQAREILVDIDERRDSWMDEDPN